MAYSTIANDQAMTRLSNWSVLGSEFIVHFKKFKLQCI